LFRKLLGKHKQPETLSLINLEQVSGLEKALINLKKALKKTPANRERIKALMEVESRSYYFLDENKRKNSGFYGSDLYAMAKKIKQEPGLNDPKLKKAAQNLMNAYKKAVPKNQNSKHIVFANSNGMGILNTNHKKLLENIGYRNLQFAKDTGWDQFYLNFAPEIKAKDLTGKLSHQILALPGFQKISRLARKACRKINSRAESEKIALETNEILKRLKNSLEDQSDENLRILSLKEDLLFSWKCCDFDKPHYSVLYAQVNLELLSALDGEVSQKTIAQAARNLLKAAKENPACLEPELKKNMEEYGLDLIYYLAYASQNYNVLNILSFPEKSDRQYLKEIAALKA